MSRRAVEPQLADPLVEVRRRAHEALDQWLDGFGPLLGGAKPPTLLELSDHVSAVRPQLLGPCVQAILDHIVESYSPVRQTSCPTCGKLLYRKRLERKKLATLHGTAVLDRPYFYCIDCRLGFHPVDEALELAREVHQYDVQKKLARLAAEMPYEGAAELFHEMTGLHVGEHLCHETVQRITQHLRLEDVLPDRVQIERRVEAVAMASRGPPILVVAVDGAHTPIRPPGGRAKKRGPGYWREAKGFRLYLISDDRIVPIASWHQIQNAEQLAQDLEIAAERVPLERVTVALVGDGSEWVWNAMERSFPEASQVLDFYHCAEHVWTVAHSHYGESLDAQMWAEATLTRLCLDRVSDVLGGLRRMKPMDRGDTEEISKLIGYLENHRHRVQYAAAKAQNLPRGSGGIESANKFLVHSRLKRSGAWWLEPNGNGMLRLRCAIYNGTFDRVFKTYVANKRNNS